MPDYYKPLSVLAQSAIDVPNTLRNASIASGALRNLVYGPRYAEGVSQEIASSGQPFAQSRSLQALVDPTAALGAAQNYALGQERMLSAEEIAAQRALSAQKDYTEVQPIILEHNAKVTELNQLLESYRLSQSQQDLDSANALYGEIGAIRSKLVGVPNIGTLLYSVKDPGGVLATQRTETRAVEAARLQREQLERQKKQDQVQADQFAKSYALSLQNFYQNKANSDFDKTQKIDDDFKSDSAVQAYQAVDQFAKSANALWADYKAKGGTTPAQLDVNIIKAFAKATLPSEAVMADDINSILAARGIGNRWKGNAEGLLNGGSLASDEERASYIAAIDALNAKARERAAVRARGIAKVAGENNIKITNPLMNDLITAPLSTDGEWVEEE